MADLYFYTNKIINRCICHVKTVYLKVNKKFKALLSYNNVLSGDVIKIFSVKRIPSSETIQKPQHFKIKDSAVCFNYTAAVN
jgi:hypothetical protein